jgi:hypothetical protein
LALVDCSKLTISQFLALVVFILEAEVVGLRFDVSHPILDGLLVSVVKDTGLHRLVVVLKREAEDIIPYVLLNLVHVETFQRNYFGGNSLLTTFIDVERVIT